eukprot:3302748-Amphidinium_carterae.1
MNQCGLCYLTLFKEVATLGRPHNLSAPPWVSNQHLDSQLLSARPQDYTVQDSLVTEVNAHAQAMHCDCANLT